MPDRPWKDEYTLLCEKCGYVVEGLDQSGNCPECGKPIVESLPERRVGTPWQQSPGVKSLLETWWMTLRHPLRTLDVMWIKRDRSSLWLSTVTIGISSFMIATGFMLPFLYLFAQGTDSDIWLSPREKWKTVALTIPVSACLLFCLTMLTWIETRGIKIIGRTRQFRVDPVIAKSITSHSCAGWLLSSLLFFALYNLGNLLIESRRPALGIDDKSFLFDYPARFIYPARAPDWVYWIDGAFWGTGLLIGFLFFETFAYLGLRRLKYANRVRPE